MEDRSRYGQKPTSSPGTSSSTPRGIAIEPPVPQAGFHAFDLSSQVLGIMAPILHESGSLRIVAPFPRILDVPAS